MQGKVAAVHARVPELEARRSELQAELAQLLDRHQALTEVLPWARQLVRASMHPCHVQSCDTSCSVLAKLHLPLQNSGVDGGAYQEVTHACRRRCSLWHQ